MHEIELSDPSKPGHACTAGKRRRVAQLNMLGFKEK